MARSELITMSLREADRIKTVQAVVDGNLQPMVGAARLGLSTRQLRRLVDRYRLEGTKGLICRSRGRPGNHQLAPGLAQRVIGIIRERYPDFGPTFACEKLAECHGLVIGRNTVRLLMTAAGLWTPRKYRKARVHQPRARRHCVGEMIQIDGSDHMWFEDRGPACTLLVYIDDATSRLMHLHFTFTESTFSYYEATRAYIERYGKPQSFYSDKAGVFRVNNPHATGGAGHTQFGRALYELNIESICANSSEAKGRVERANLTLQDRLVKEMRLAEVSTMAEGNAFVIGFMADFNQRFAVVPRNDLDVHRPKRSDEDLDLIFTVREDRKVTQMLTLQYDKTLYLLTDSPLARQCVGRYIDVYEYPDGRIEVRAEGTVLPCTTYDRLSEIDQGAVIEHKRLGHMLAVAKLVQEGRDNRRSRSIPSRRNQGRPVVEKQMAPGKKSQRAIGRNELNDAIESTANAPLAPGFRPSRVNGVE